MPKFTKSVLSQYLRTRCEKQLYLSLQTSDDIRTRNLPGPKKLRPQIRMITAQGREWEAEKYLELHQVFAGRTRGLDADGRKRNDVNLATELAEQLQPNFFVVEGTISHPQLRDSICQGLKLPDATANLIPEFGDFRPDLVWIREKTDADFEIATSGLVEPIDTEDPRQPLVVIDVKHAATGNPSYSSEVTLYAFVLANWLRLVGLQDRYFVSHETGLWTRAHHASNLLTAGQNATVQDLAAALTRDIEWVPSLQFLPTVRDFLEREVPTVLQKDLDELEWHVDNRCGSCDWLAHEAWLRNQDDRDEVERSGQYCYSRARALGHLSRIPTLTRGSRRVLEDANIRDLQALAELQPTAPEFRRHNRLRSDAHALPTRAVCIRDGTPPQVANAVRSDIANWVELQIFISVNFDPGTGFLTALGFQAWFRPWTPPQPRPVAGPAVHGPASRLLRRDAIVVTADTIDAERDVVLAFLNQLAAVFTIITRRGDGFGGQNPDRNRTQVYFWEYRQFEELSLALGRHIESVLSDDTIRGLAWLFPPEELLERPDDADCPTIVFIKPSVTEAVSVNVPHVYTLFGVYEQYNIHPPQRLPDQYFRDPLSDMIPRERIYEIWHQVAQPFGWQEVLERYRRTVQSQCDALAQITWRFRRDADCIGRAPRLRLDGLTNYRGLSADSRIWYAWTLLDDNLAVAEAKSRFASRVEMQEAAYDCVRLGNFIGRDAAGALIFEVQPDSTNAKFSEGDGFLALRCDQIPGFLHKHVKDLPHATGAGYPGDWDRASNYYLYKVFGGVKLISLDRPNRRVTIRLSDFGEHPTIRAHLERLGVIDYQHQWSIIEGTGVDSAKLLRSVLGNIGNPRIATPHPASRLVYGNVAPPRRFTAGVMPSAEVLWTAQALSATQTAVDQVQARDLIQAFDGRLNESQRDALEVSLTRRLSVIWGPPGTGKTDTLAALLACHLMHASVNDHPVRILVTGPTYKALTELAKRFIPHADRLLKDMPLIIARLFSTSRDIDTEVPQPKSENAELLNLQTGGDRRFIAICQALRDGGQSIIVFAPPRQVPKIARSATAADVGELFDVCVIDESSQVTVGNAILALGSLTRGFTLTIAGDSKQMPPIFQTDPPANAEFLVGSFQKYLVDGYAVPEQPLNINYRSASEFVRFAHLLGYNRQLEAWSPNLQLSLETPGLTEPSAMWPADVAFGSWVRAILDPTTPFVSVLYGDGVCGQYNDFEAALVVALCVQLRDSMRLQLANERDEQGNPHALDARLHSAETFWRDGVGIVTPHKAQRVAIAQRLKNVFAPEEHTLIEEAVDTVERFQGGQRDVILISFGVGDPDLIAQEEEFLLQLERINVAVSRGRAKCICFISRELAYHLPDTRRAVDTAKAVKSFVFDLCSTSSTHDASVGNDARALEVRRSEPNTDEDVGR